MMVNIHHPFMAFRLPIVQGSSFAFLLPTLAILNLPKWQCPDMEGDYINYYMNVSTGIEFRQSLSQYARL